MSAPVQARTRDSELCYFEFSGTRIHYRALGTGDPLLFLHNGGASHRIWERQVDHFSTSHQCIAFDLPGYGLSRNLALRTNLDFHVAFLAAFCRARGIERPTLVGNCMGSAIALKYASSRPSKAQRLVLFNVLTKRTVTRGPYAPIFRLTEALPGLRGALRALASRLVTPRALLGRTLSAHWGTWGRRDAGLEAELGRLYRQRGQLAALSDLVADVDELAALDELSLPASFPRTLVVWGAANRVLPVAGGLALATTLRPHRFEAVPGGGHLLMHEQFVTVNRIMEDFLDAPDSARYHSRAQQCW